MTESNTSADRDWIDQVVATYEASLIAYATRIVGNPERGRDIVQDVFLLLCRELAGHPRDRLAPWLFTVCRNRALDESRREQRMKRLTPEYMQTVSSHGPDPATQLEHHEEASLAESLLARLPERQQELVRLKIEHGLSYREISEVTGLTPSNIGYLLHQSIHQLRADYARIHERSP